MAWVAIQNVFSSPSAASETLYMYGSTVWVAEISCQPKDEAADWWFRSEVPRDATKRPARKQGPRQQSTPTAPTAPTTTG